MDKETQTVLNRAVGAEQGGLARQASAKVPTIVKRRKPDEVQPSLHFIGPSCKCMLCIEGVAKGRVLSAGCSSRLSSMRCTGMTQG